MHVEFLLDYIGPYAYLANAQIKNAASPSADIPAPPNPKEEPMNMSAGREGRRTRSMVAVQ